MSKCFHLYNHLILSIRFSAMIPIDYIYIHIHIIYIYIIVSIYIYDIIFTCTSRYKKKSWTIHHVDHFRENHAPGLAVQRCWSTLWLLAGKRTELPFEGPMLTGMFWESKNMDAKSVHHQLIDANHIPWFWVSTVPGGFFLIGAERSWKFVGDTNLGKKWDIIGMFWDIIGISFGISFGKKMGYHLWAVLGLGSHWCWTYGKRERSK